MYKKRCNNLIDELKITNQYREFKEINRIGGNYPLAKNNSSESSTLNWTTPLRGCIVKLRK